eukprot:GHVU01124423.1.p1 GENE.GHVU01124423.1~~GHVU01124423.1.p1  ORF type:complete len:221 (-),score=17.08 GHVU01124423.1:203-865(-)
MNLDFPEGCDEEDKDRVHRGLHETWTELMLSGDERQAMALELLCQLFFTRASIATTVAPSNPRNRLSDAEVGMAAMPMREPVKILRLLCGISKPRDTDSVGNAPEASVASRRRAIPDVQQRPVRNESLQSCVLYSSGLVHPADLGLDRNHAPFAFSNREHRIAPAVESEAADSLFGVTLHLPSTPFGRPAPVLQDLEQRRLPAADGGVAALEDYPGVPES